MFLELKCLGRQLLATFLWGATVPSPTEVVWSILIHPLKT
ncbi:hypothetical protein OIU84_020048 [Salix udensis]|uniref:Uncharacterized protein n=1 Tax=Salix udensis TaxID=889485 RepID=A0AAD6PK56_9ROSI|nr:hypothetical protein OIU84_020048 [Salix udensis]